MAITDAELLLEIGATAYNDLSDVEIEAILAKFTSAQVRLAGMTVFDLLRKNFKADYRMGRAYEARSKKYEHYNNMYNDYARTTGAGKVTGSDDDVEDYNNVDRWKFTADGN